MSKSKIVHPLPLAAIRGSLELCKFKLGRLVHKGYSPERDTAKYWATITEFPDDRAAESFSPYELLLKLNGCYPGNVVFFDLMFQRGRWSVFLYSSRESLTSGMEWLA